MREALCKRCCDKFRAGSLGDLRQKVGDESLEQSSAMHKLHILRAERFYVVLSATMRSCMISIFCRSREIVFGETEI